MKRAPVTEFRPNPRERRSIVANGLRNKSPGVGGGEGAELKGRFGDRVKVKLLGGEVSSTGLPQGSSSPWARN